MMKERKIEKNAEKNRERKKILYAKGKSVSGFQIWAIVFSRFELDPRNG